MTYDSSLSRDIDQVRYLIGDTTGVAATEYAKDEEIQWALGEAANIYMAAADVCMSIYRKARIGGVHEKKVGETEIKYDRAMEFRGMAEDLRARGSAYKKPTSGGVEVSETETYEEDTSLIQPAFGIGKFDNPNATKTATEIS